jgi:hypothetical protein
MASVFKLHFYSTAGGGGGGNPRRLNKVTCYQSEDWSLISSRDKNLLLCYNVAANFEVYPVSFQTGAVEKFPKVKWPERKGDFFM